MKLGQWPEPAVSGEFTGGRFQKEIIVLPVRKARCVHYGQSHKHLSQEPSEVTASFSQALGKRVSSPLPLGSKSKGGLSATFLPFP